MSESGFVSFRELSRDDAPKIAAAIAQLASIGLKPLFPERELLDVARRQLEEDEGCSIPDPPLPLTWVDLALSGPEQVFANAVHHQDHCFDVAGESDYAEVVASIMALAGDEWPRATVSATGIVREGRYGPSDRMAIAIHGPGGAAPFELLADKDFDWSVVTRLNERLPAGATGRFAAFFDGNATIVYLKPDQLKQLGELFGYDFISEIEPLEERPPSQGHLEAAVQGPVRVWPVVGGLLLGGIGASQLIGMILRGTPYTIEGSGSTAVSFANAPVEFTFKVTAFSLGTVFFLAPAYLVVRGWLSKRSPDEP
jgi:hypothetical protein